MRTSLDIITLFTALLLAPFAAPVVVADNCTIVMGSSHIEPMLHSNIAGAE